MRLFPQIFRVLFAVASGSAILTAPVYADDSWVNEATLGFDLRYYDYKEYVDLPKASTESGWLPGMTASYEGGNSLWDLTSQLYFSPGNTNYAGTTQAAVPITGTTQNIFFSLEQDFGIKIPYGPLFYAGISYNLWMRDIDPLGHPNYTGLEEDYTWWDFPVGVSWKADLSNSLYLIFGIEADIMFSAQIDARWSGITTGAADSVVPLGSTLGGKTYLKFGWRFDPTWGILTSLYYQYSGFIQSATFEELTTSGTPLLANGQPQYYDEPSSSHRSYGLNLALTYRF